MSGADKFSADKTSLGFEFQDFVYVEKLISLREGQALGLELHDDIHAQTVSDDGSIQDLTLIQVKHSVEPGNVTDRDIDLWKTLHNWLQIIPGLPSHRNLTLQLYTNKGLNNQEFVSLLKSPRQNIEAIISHIRSTNEKISLVESKKKPDESKNPLAKYVQSVCDASNEELNHLFSRFEFHSDDSSVIGRISSELRQLSVPAPQIEETRRHVIGAFKESKFSRIISGEKVVITFDDFRTTMGFDRIIRSARSEPIDFDRFIDFYYEYERPHTLSFRSSKFHEQLQDIGIHEEEIIDRGVEMVLSEQFIQSLKDSGSFSASDDSRLENKALSDWQLLHNQSHRNTPDDDEPNHLKASQHCYDKTMKKQMTAGGVEIPINLSCGKYIKLSNIPRIGWRKNWRSKF